jgi:hypothetical protein
MIQETPPVSIKPHVTPPLAENLHVTVGRPYHEETACVGTDTRADSGRP